MPSNRGTSKTPRLILAGQFLIGIPLGTSSTDSKDDTIGKSTDATVAGEGGLLIGGSSTQISSAELARLRDEETLGLLDPSTQQDIIIRLKGEKFKHITSRGARWSHLFVDALQKERVADGRIIFSSNKSYPMSVFSLIRYDAEVEDAQEKARQTAASRLLTVGVYTPNNLPDSRLSQSHGHLLFPEYGLINAGILNNNNQADWYISERELQAGSLLQYSPYILDDPADDIRYDRRQYSTVEFSTSVLLYHPESSLKSDLNQAFAQRHPWLDLGDVESLKLSHIRALKKKCTRAWFELGAELSSLAVAFVCFERLVLRRLVSKENRKIAMSACLLIAFKMTEFREGEPLYGPGECAEELHVPDDTDEGVHQNRRFESRGDEVEPNLEHYESSFDHYGGGVTSSFRGSTFSGIHGSSSGGNNGASVDSSDYLELQKYDSSFVKKLKPLRQESYPEITTSAIITLIENTLGVSKSVVLSAEFPVFAHLGFALHIPEGFVDAHLERIFDELNITPSLYFGAEDYQ